MQQQEVEEGHGGYQGSQQGSCRERCFLSKFSVSQLKNIFIMSIEELWAIDKYTKLNEIAKEIVLTFG